MADVLIVDDDDTTRITFRDALEDAGHMVELAASGEIACALLGNHIPDVILLDLNLPGMDGYSVLTWMRTNHVAAPTAVMTGFADLFELADAIALGAAMYLRKPVFIEQLFDVVRILGRRPISVNGEPAADVITDLHFRVVLRDLGAIEEIAARLLRLLVPQLQRRFPNTARDLAADAVEDAILEYASCPGEFDATRGVSLSKFLYIASWRNLADLVKRERRHEAREATFATDRFTAVTENQPGERDTSELRTVLLDAAGNEAERRTLSAWLNGTRSTHVLAESLGISHLSASEQRREVKRFKDRILKRVARSRMEPSSRAHRQSS